MCSEIFRNYTVNNQKKNSILILCVVHGIDKPKEGIIEPFFRLPSFEEYEEQQIKNHTKLEKHDIFIHLKAAERATTASTDNNDRRKGINKKSKQTNKKLVHNVKAEKKSFFLSLCCFFSNIFFFNNINLQ
jgi:hypothetical protein